VLVRKGDEMPMLLLHASQFAKVNDWLHIYDGQESFIAPEVLAGETMTERSDIYSLGCFIKWLFSQGSLPYEYKTVVAKATKEDATKRYASIADMRSALIKARAAKRSVISLAIALFVALVCVGLFFEMMPEGEDIEFVQAAPKEADEDLLDAGFDPMNELAQASPLDSAMMADSLAADTIADDERQTMETYMKKAEDIFRKQFAKEADRILTKIYSDENMNASEKTFIANSNAMRDELMKIQNTLAEQAGISDNRAGRIATEEIDRITREKDKRKVIYYDASEEENE
jgi:serine/threonine protein kinase